MNLWQFKNARASGGGGGAGDGDGGLAARNGPCCLPGRPTVDTVSARRTIFASSRSERLTLRFLNQIQAAARAVGQRNARGDRGAALARARSLTLCRPSIVAADAGVSRRRARCRGTAPVGMAGGTRRERNRSSNQGARLGGGPGQPARRRPLLGRPQLVAQQRHGAGTAAVAALDAAGRRSGSRRQSVRAAAVRPAAGHGL